MGAARKLRKLQEGKAALRGENTLLREALAQALGIKNGSSEKQRCDEVSSGGTLPANSALSNNGGTRLSDIGSETGEATAKVAKDAITGCGLERSAAVADDAPDSNNSGQYPDERVQRFGDIDIKVYAPLPHQRKQKRDRPQGAGGFARVVRRATAFLCGTLASIVQRISGAMCFRKR